MTVTPVMFWCFAAFQAIWFVVMTVLAIGFLKHSRDYRTIVASHRSDLDIVQAMLLDHVVLGVSLDRLESSDAVKGVWVITKDLEPDISQERVADVVRGNLQRGVMYRFFAHKTCQHERLAKIQEMFSYEQLGSPDHLLCVEWIEESRTFETFKFHSNTVIYFRDFECSRVLCAFEELEQARLTSKGGVWQPIAQARAAEIIDEIRRKMG